MKKQMWDHPKLERLKREMGIPRWQAIGLLQSLWLWTAKFAPRGDIGKWQDEDIAAGLEWDGDVEELINALVKCRLVDRDEVHRLLIHDWSEHAEDSVHLALARKGQCFADGKFPKGMKNYSQSVGTVSEHVATVSEHVATVSEHVATNHVPSTMDHVPSTMDHVPSTMDHVPRKNKSQNKSSERHWQNFISFYPPRAGDRKVAKGREKFESLLRSGVPPERLIAGAQKYREYCDSVGLTGTQFVKQITTFLNNRSWDEDYVSPVANHPRGAHQLSMQDRVEKTLEVYHARYGAKNCGDAGDIPGDMAITPGDTGTGGDMGDEYHESGRACRGDPQTSIGGDHA